MNDEQSPSGQLLIYDDGRLNLQVRLDGQTVWLTQAQMAELYQSTKQNVSLHIQNVFDDNELPADSVVKEYLTTAADGTQYERFDQERRAVADASTSDFDQAVKRITEQAPQPKPSRRKKKGDELADDDE